MILNLNKLNVQKSSSNSLMASQSFLSKNKITLNQVTQSHFTVQGVQMYSPAQIKALKESQQRGKNLQNRQPVEVKTYHIADYFEQFQQTKEMNPKEKVKQILRAKMDKDVGKNFSVVKQPAKSQTKGLQNLSVKQRVAQNNKAISRLEKQRNKKTLLQKKLAQLSQHYKQYFKEKNNQQDEVNIDLNKSLADNISNVTQDKQKDDFSKQQGKSQQGDEVNQKQQNNKNKSQFNKKKQKVLSNSSTNYTKMVSKNNKSRQNQKSSAIKEDQTQNVQFQYVQQGLDLIGQIISNRSTYSEKLGSAVHQLFN